MTPKQAAEIIGCSPQQVRTLIRSGKLRANKKPLQYPGMDAPNGYVYDISLKEAERIRDLPKRQGRPRGSNNKPS